MLEHAVTTDPLRHMNKERQQTKTNRIQPLPPLISAADINEANYPRGYIDESIADTIEHIARQRAPTRGSVFSHRVGFASELIASTYWGLHPTGRSTQTLMEMMGTTLRWMAGGSRLRP